MLTITKSLGENVRIIESDEFICQANLNGTVAISTATLKSFTESQIQALLAHEQAHIARKTALRITVATWSAVLVSILAPVVVKRFGLLGRVGAFLVVNTASGIPIGWVRHREEFLADRAVAEQGLGQELMMALRSRRVIQTKTMTHPAVDDRVQNIARYMKED